MADLYYHEHGKLDSTLLTWLALCGPGLSPVSVAQPILMPGQMAGRGQQAAVQDVWHGDEDDMCSMPRERRQSLIWLSEVPEKGLASARLHLWDPHRIRAMSVCWPGALAIAEPAARERASRWQFRGSRWHKRHTVDTTQPMWLLREVAETIRVAKVNPPVVHSKVLELPVVRA